MSDAEDEVREIATTEHTILQMVSKAELDQQIATAHAYPRSVKKFRAKCLEMATLNEQIADECIYALPRKEGGQTKMIEGPSARLAEIVANAWGNNRAGARVVDEGREFVTAQGVFHDLEANAAITYEVRRRITNRSGQRFSADMISVTANAACSIALRNAIFKGVPKAFWSDIYEAARKVVAGDSQTLVNRRSGALASLQKIGATQDKVIALLGVAGVEDITLDHLATLRGLYNAVKEGELPVEQAFAAPGEVQPAGEKPASRADQAKDALKGQDKIPHFDEATARAAINGAKTPTELESKWKEIATDYKNSGRDLPLDLEAAKFGRAEHLKQQEK
jgi:hypothetical protein